MDFDKYVELSEETAIYPSDRELPIYPVLGLVGEAGEVAEKVKKAIRDDGGELTDEKLEELIDEIGDVVWYIAALCRDLDISLDYVARHNLEKLLDREERGVLQGSGDDR